MRASVLILCTALAATSQSPLFVPYTLVVNGQPYKDAVDVTVTKSNSEVVRGASDGERMKFFWQPTSGQKYKVDIVAGPHRIVLDAVDSREFDSATVWQIELDYPPFRNSCGRAVRPAEGRKVVRVDCIVFDHGTGDPPQHVIKYMK